MHSGQNMVAVCIRPLLSEYTNSIDMNTNMQSRSATAQYGNDFLVKYQLDIFEK